MPFNRFLHENWPEPTHVQDIIDKSSGQFVYAAVVVDFVSLPHRHPSQQLEIICGLRQAGKLTPFSQLDALYRHIFSQVQDSDGTSRVLAFAIFGSGPFSLRPDALLGISSDNIRVLMADLTSIVIYDDPQFRFLHASLPEFLMNQTRSQRYYLDKRFWCTHFSVRCFHMISEGTELGT